jgi:transposase-like protein
MENLNSLNRRSENVVIKAVIIAELELSDIEREILGADLVERADDTALEDAPKALNRLSVDGCVCRKLDSAILMVKAAKDRS